MGALSGTSFYLGQYGQPLALSFFYFAAISFVGLLLVLRRASLFGLVLSGVAQFSILVGMALHFASHPEGRGLFEGGDLDRAIADLAHYDLYLFPLTLCLMLPFIFFMSRESLNMESVLASALVFLMGLLPLANKMLGGSDLVLLKAYFTEILYTPRELFAHYLLHLGAVAVLCAVFFRRFLLCGFDPVQARLQGVRVELYNALFYLLAGFAIALCVRVLGVYVTMMALLAPGILALSLFTGLRAVAAATVALSLVFAAGGYLVSFTFDDMPTEPTIIVFFGVAAASVWGARWAWMRLHGRGKRY